MNKEQKLLQVSATIEKIETRSDNTLKLTVGTQEMHSDDEALLIKLRNKLGYFLFKETRIRPEELKIPEAIKEIKEGKSSSQRLRSVLFVYWEQQKPTKLFEDFYKGYIEKIIDNIKEKLN